MNITSATGEVEKGQRQENNGNTYIYKFIK